VSRKLTLKLNIAIIQKGRPHIPFAHLKGSSSARAREASVEPADPAASCGLPGGILCPQLFMAQMAP